MCSADTALETRGAGSTVQRDLGKDHRCYHHTAHLSDVWLRTRYLEDGARGSNSTRVPKAPALLISSSPSVTSTPFYNLRVRSGGT